MVDYSGYFMQGMAEGISQGMDWGTNIIDIRERKKAKVALKKEQEKINS